MVIYSESTTKHSSLKNRNILKVCVITNTAVTITYSLVVQWSLNWSNLPTFHSGSWHQQIMTGCLLMCSDKRSQLLPKSQYLMDVNKTCKSRLKFISDVIIRFLSEAFNSTQFFWNQKNTQSKQTASCSPTPSTGHLNPAALPFILSRTDSLGQRLSAFASSRISSAPIYVSSCHMIVEEDGGTINNTRPGFCLCVYCRCTSESDCCHQCKCCFF